MPCDVRQRPVLTLRTRLLIEEHQTSNLGVRGSNPFRRANIVLKTLVLPLHHQTAASIRCRDGSNVEASAQVLSFRAGFKAARTAPRTLRSGAVTGGAIPAPTLDRPGVGMALNT